MRLIHSETLQLKEFLPGRIPPYAILSHTWGDDEVTLEDMQSQREGWRHTAGWAKIQTCARRAAADGYSYVWVDTCCIDKKSSAELQEAINSMYRWYQRSQVCYAYLSDVPSGQSPSWPDSAFRKARWFTRGWTLQELLAPLEVIFFSEDWSVIGDLHRLRSVVEEITGIDGKCLDMNRLTRTTAIESSSIAKRMSWASRRITTREEDAAYCLLGIFDINMPLLYGEGTKAFVRLQQEIMKISDDSSIFSWGFEGNSVRPHEAIPWRAHARFSRRFGLAESPADFSNCADIIHFRFTDADDTAFETTQKGLELCLLEMPDPNFLSLSYGVLNCGMQVEDTIHFLAFTFYQPSAAQIRKSRYRASIRTLVTLGSDFVFDFAMSAPPTKICLPRNSGDPYTGFCRIGLSPRVHGGYEVVATYPHQRNTKMIYLYAPNMSFAQLYYLREKDQPRGVLIRFKFENPGNGRDWTCKAIRWDEPPMYEFLVQVMNQDTFWDSHEPCPVKDGEHVEIAYQDLLG